MYEKPKLERFGTFRELTQVGFNGNSDGFTVCGVPGASGTGSDVCGGATTAPCLAARS